MKGFIEVTNPNNGDKILVNVNNIGYVKNGVIVPVGSVVTNVIYCKEDYYEIKMKIRKSIKN